MSDIAILALLVTSGAFIVGGLAVLLGSLVEDSIKEHIGR